MNQEEPTIKRLTEEERVRILAALENRQGIVFVAVPQFAEIREIILKDSQKH